MIWLAERIAALVVIIIGRRIVFNLVQGWWHSQDWLRAAVVAVLNGAWHILCALALFFALLTPDRMDCPALGLANLWRRSQLRRAIGDAP